jgi:hypothetical protein
MREFAIDQGSGCLASGARHDDCDLTCFEHSLSHRLLVQKKGAATMGSGDPKSRHEVPQRCTGDGENAAALVQHADCFGSSSRDEIAERNSIGCDVFSYSCPCINDPLIRPSGRCSGGHSPDSLYGAPVLLIKEIGPPPASSGPSDTSRRILGGFGTGAASNKHGHSWVVPIPPIYLSSPNRLNPRPVSARPAVPP